MTDTSPPARRTTLEARNKIREGLAAWCRALSLGLIAIGIIEPMRSGSSADATAYVLGVLGAVVTLALSCAILATIEEKPQ